MSGMENKIIYGEGFKLQPSSADSISRMQETASTVSRVNYTGNPEGNVSANPSSLSHDPTTGNFYLKKSGTGNTGWVLLETSVSDLHVAKLIVNSTAGAGGNYTTIAAALTAAVAGDTIFVMPGSSGVYTEDLTLKSGVNIVAFSADANTPNVTISGNATATFSGTCSLSGLRLQTNSGDFLTVSGSSATVVNLNNCFLNCLNNTGISYTSSNANSSVNCNYCLGDLGTTGIGLYSMSSVGNLNFNHCTFKNTGSSLSASANSAGLVNCFASEFDFQLSTTSTGGLKMFQSMINLQTLNTTNLVLNGSGGTVLFNMTFRSGSATPITIGASAQVFGDLIHFTSTNTTKVSGAGGSQFVYGLIGGNGGTSDSFTGVSTPDTTSWVRKLIASEIALSGGSLTAVPVPIAQGGSNATSFGTTHGIVAYDGTSLVNYAGPQLSTGGVQTNTSQPCFSAYLGTSATNATGDGTAYTVIFDQAPVNQGASYNTSTGVFTAPVTGTYLFASNIFMSGIVSQTAFINTFAGSVWVERFVQTALATSFSGSYASSGSIIINMTAGDTMSITAASYGSTKTVTINGGAQNVGTGSTFGGYLIA